MVGDLPRSRNKQRNVARKTQRCVPALQSVQTALSAGCLRKANLSTCFFLIFILFIVVRILIFGTNEGLYPTKNAFLCEDTNINWPYQEESVGVAVITFSFVYYPNSCGKLSFIMSHVPCLLLTNIFVSSRTPQFVNERPECAQSNVKLLRHHPHQTLFYIISKRKMYVKVFLHLSCCMQFKVTVRADQVF